MTVWEFNPIPKFSVFSAGNFLFPTWALWTSIRHNQSGVNVGVGEDTHRETLTMSLCKSGKTEEEGVEKREKGAMNRAH